MVPRVSFFRHLSNSWFDGRVEVFFDRDSLTMVEATIAGAQCSIDMEMFMIGGEYGERILRLLDRKARNGVQVRLIHREGASIRFGVLLKRLAHRITLRRRMNAERHYVPATDRLFQTELKFSPIMRGHFPLGHFGPCPLSPLKLAHDKLIIVDGNIAIMGGLNLAAAVADNHDLLIRISGPAVTAAAAIFTTDWSLTHPGEEGNSHGVSLDSISSAESGPDRLRFLVTRPGARKQLTAVLQLIDGACERLWIEMFYLTEPLIIQALSQAVIRGVNVRVICDPNEYSLGLPMRGAPNLPFVSDMIAAGVPVRLFRALPGNQMHQKSLLLDSEHVYTGATNFTRMSFLANTESSVVIRSKHVAEIFERRFREDWEEHSVLPDMNLIRRRRAYLGVVRLLSFLV